MDARVLVVDDEPIQCRLITRWLTHAGYCCHCVDGFDAAWSHLQQNPVDIVTADIMMPGRTGIDLLRQIRGEFSDIEVVMLTGVNEAKTAIEALTLGACGYLIKPVEHDDLLLQMDKAVERRRMFMERRRYTARLEETVREQMLAVCAAHEETVKRLVSASLFRDEETGAHIIRTALCSELLAQSLDWADADVENLRLAAPMHDVGKIGIPDAILLKPGKLTEEEFRLMKTHTTIGASMLAGSNSKMLQMAETIALCHHERWDGSGYPRGLRGSDIPEAARILAIVDVYDALTHDRIYRPAFSHDTALEMMVSDRGHFDPSILEVFLAIHPRMQRIAAENPNGSAPAPDRTENGHAAPFILEPPSSMSSSAANV